MLMVMTSTGQPGKREQHQHDPRQKHPDAKAGVLEKRHVAQATF
jgi:hypothetical protein